VELSIHRYKKFHLRKIISKLPTNIIRSVRDWGYKALQTWWKCDNYSQIISSYYIIKKCKFKTWWIFKRWRFKIIIVRRIHKWLLRVFKLKGKIVFQLLIIIKINLLRKFNLSDNPCPNANSPELPPFQCRCHKMPMAFPTKSTFNIPKTTWQLGNIVQFGSHVRTLTLISWKEHLKNYSQWFPINYWVCMMLCWNIMRLIWINFLNKLMEFFRPMTTS